MKYQKILAASKADAIDAVINGLAVEADGFLLSHEQMDNLEAALANADATLQQLQQQHQDTTGQLSAAQAELQSVQSQVDTAQSELATANQPIAQLQAQVAQLSEQTPAPNTTARPTDPEPPKNKELPSVKYAQSRGIYSKG